MCYTKCGPLENTVYTKCQMALSSRQHQSPVFSRRWSEHTDRKVKLKPTVLFRTTPTLFISYFHHAKFKILLNSVLWNFVGCSSWAWEFTDNERAQHNPTLKIISNTFSNTILNKISFWQWRTVYKWTSACKPWPCGPLLKYAFNKFNLTRKEKQNNSVKKVLVNL